MHSGRIENSERHKRVLRAFMAADHPLSGEETSEIILAEIGKIPQAVSTTIGEMRSEENIADGYLVSFACVWRAVKPGEQPGPRMMKNGGTVFLLSEATAPWHDGRPRYWLQAAPGWSPRWAIDSNGKLKSVRSAEPAELRNAECGMRSEDQKQEEPRLCANKLCRKPVPYGYTCDEACNAAWREQLRPKPEGVLF